MITITSNGGIEGGEVTNSLEQAKQRVRELLISNPAAQVRVELSDGVYRLESPLVFDNRDCSAKGGDVVWAALPGASPVVSISKPLSGWRKPLEYNPEIPESVLDKIFECSMPRFAGAGVAVPKVLFIGGQQKAAVTGAGFAPTRSEQFVDCIDDMEGYRSGPFDKLEFPAGALKNWSNLTDVEVRIRPTWAWLLNILPLAEVDEQALVARTAVAATYPMRRQVFEEAFNLGSDSCWVLNSYEHLSKYGDWAADSKRGVITMVTDGRPPRAVEIPCGVEIIRVEGGQNNPVTNLRFEGITFTGGDRYTFAPDDIGLQHDWDLYQASNSLVRLEGVQNIGLVNCRFVEAGGGGVRVDGAAKGVSIEGCRFKNLGGTGILLCGFGPGHADVNGGHTVRGNHIRRVGLHYAGSPGIFVWQSGGNCIDGNVLHDLPYNGIVLSGARTPFLSEPTQGVRELFGTVNRQAIAPDVAKLRQWLSEHPQEDWRAMMGSYEAHCFFEKWMTARDNIVENNEIFDVMKMLADGNGIYLSATGRGTVIRNNYLHDIVSLHGSPIRCDGQQYWTTIEKNLILNCSGGIQIRNETQVRGNWLIDEVLPPHSTNYAVWLPSVVVMREILGCWRQFLPEHLRTPVNVTVEDNYFCQSSGLVDFTEHAFRTLDYPGQELCGIDFDRNIYCAPGDPNGLDALLRKRRQMGRDLNSVTKPLPNANEKVLKWKNDFGNGIF